MSFTKEEIVYNELMIGVSIVALAYIMVVIMITICKMWWNQNGKWFHKLYYSFFVYQSRYPYTHHILYMSYIDINDILN